MSIDFIIPWIISSSDTSRNNLCFKPLGGATKSSIFLGKSISFLMDFVSGKILTDMGLKSGYIAFENRKIVEIGKGNPPRKPICKGFIVPSFVNAHTHIGDSFVKERGIDLPKNIEDLVAPPNGLKHKLLREVSDKDIIRGMKKSIDIMIKNGTKYFCDFRENGILGISQLKTALNSRKISSIILSRPCTLSYDKN